MTKSPMWDHKITGKKLAYRSGHSTDISEHNSGNRKEVGGGGGGGTVNSNHNTVNSKHNSVNSKHNTVNSKHNSVNSKHNTVNSKHNTVTSQHNAVNANSQKQRQQSTANTTQQQLQHSQQQHNTINSRHDQIKAVIDKQVSVSAFDLFDLLILTDTHILNPVLSRRIQYTIRTQLISTQELCPVYHDAAHSHIFWGPLKFCERSKGKPA